MKLSILWTKATALMLIVGCAAARDPRSFEHLSRCIKMAEPLIRDPKYIFPLNIQDIREVCSMWGNFIDCVYGYATTYMTSTQQQDFNRTIQSNNEMIQRLCSEDPDYQKLYMAYAPCMKRVSTGPTYCGNHYKYLTDIVQGRSVNDGQLCCAHMKFRECVLDKTAVECDGGGMLLSAGNSPSQYMKELIDQTMGFLIQKCKDFLPNPRDCPNNIPGVTVAEAENSVAIGVEADDLTRTNDLPLADPATELLSTFSAVDPPFRPSSSTPSTTRFTWTTRAPSGTQRTSEKPGPPINLAGNGLLGPASQQFKDAGHSTAPHLVIVILTAMILLKM